MGGGEGVLLTLYLPLAREWRGTASGTDGDRLPRGGPWGPRRHIPMRAAAPLRQPDPGEVPRLPTNPP